jgi:hypothetical protein
VRLRYAATPAMEVAAALGILWINARRRRYRRRGGPLSAPERSALNPYFDSSLLDRVRVCRVQRIEPGLPAWLVRLLRLPASMDISFAGGMAFVDAIAVSRSALERENPESLLFHELVHCAQYRELGTYRFLRKYLRGWVAAGFDYFSIPLEEQAYALQDRFERGEVFDAQAAVHAGLASHNAL